MNFTTQTSASDSLRLVTYRVAADGMCSRYQGSQRQHPDVTRNMILMGGRGLTPMTLVFTPEA